VRENEQVKLIFFQGKLTLKSGDTYNGEWRHGVPHGEGELLLMKPKRHYKGYFSHGRVFFFSVQNDFLEKNLHGEFT
jgi:hypothetical protein